MLLGVVAAALGIYLLFRPFASLGTLVWLVAAAMTVNGVADLPAAREEEHSRVGPRLAHPLHHHYVALRTQGPQPHLFGQWAARCVLDAAGRRGTSRA